VPLKARTPGRLCSSLCATNFYCYTFLHKTYFSGTKKRAKSIDVDRSRTCIIRCFVKFDLVRFRICVQKAT
jgi:hypothetical protein